MTTISGRFHATAEGTPLRAPAVLMVPGPGAAPEELHEFVVTALPPGGQRDWLTFSDERLKEFATLCRICMKDDREAVARFADQYSLGLPWRFINDIDREGQTPLMRAIGERDPALVEKLLQEGATIDVDTLIHAIKKRVPLNVLYQVVNSDSASRQNRQGDRALTVAARTGNVEAARFLLSSNDSRDAPVLNAALCAAAEAGHATIVYMVLDLAEAVIDPVPALQLVSKFYDPAQRSYRAIFDKLIFVAWRKPQKDDGWKTVLDSLCLVAEKDGKFSALGTVFVTLADKLLILATRLNHARAVNLLLDAGVPIHGCTGYNSMLHHELATGREPSCEMAALFLKRFKERNVNWGGSRCIERAGSFGNLDLVELLKRYGSPTTPDNEKWIREYRRQDGMQ
jgi:ankyrin repeat protein